jgi:pimeloyl-ACP methyl ester carboxylesterase
MSELNLPDVTLFYEQRGEGPDIFWLAGGDQPGGDWHLWQTPAFPEFRHTTYDARGVGRTVSRNPPPWPMALYGEDAVALIEAVCDAPVFLVGLSMGSLIAQQACLDRPDLVRSAVLMGTYARATGYVREWEEAEVEFRRQGGRLSLPFATTHYGVYMYPTDVLGDDDLWAKLKPFVERDYGERDGEGLAAQWEACVEFDSLDRLPGCRVPIHVIAFSHDVQTPPVRGKLVADTVPNGHFHLLEGLGHCSAFGHQPDVVNACIRRIVEADALPSRR